MHIVFFWPFFWLINSHSWLLGCVFLFFSGRDSSESPSSLRIETSVEGDFDPSPSFLDLLSFSLLLSRVWNFGLFLMTTQSKKNNDETKLDRKKTYADNAVEVLD